MPQSQIVDIQYVIFYIELLSLCKVLQTLHVRISIKYSGDAMYIVEILPL